MKKEPIVCPDCDGSGQIRCTACKGLGVDRKDPLENCRYCWGKGTVACEGCKGAGMIEACN